MIVVSLQSSASVTFYVLVLANMGPAQHYHRANPVEFYVKMCNPGNFGEKTAKPGRGGERGLRCSRDHVSLADVSR